MKCLTIRQPWLFAIEQMNWKRVENRSWAVPVTAVGTVIALHASKRVEWDAEFPSGYDWRDGEPPISEREFHLGAIGSVARIASCHLSPDFGGTCGATRPLCSAWSVADQYHWLLDDVRLLPEPVSCKGALGLWTLPDDVERAVRAQLGETR